VQAEPMVKIGRFPKPARSLRELPQLCLDSPPSPLQRRPVRDQERIPAKKIFQGGQRRVAVGIDHKRPLTAARRLNHLDMAC
jgi:hypothetical protein